MRIERTHDPTIEGWGCQPDEGYLVDGGTVLIRHGDGDSGG